MKKLIVPIILLLCSFMYGTACPTSGYLYKVSLTVAAQSSTTTDMTRFPAVYIGNTNWKTVGNGGFLQSSTGIDVVFCDSIIGGNLLPYELVSGTYTPTTGAGEWWIQLPSVSHSTSVVIYAFFDNASATDQSNTAGVWQNVTASNINAAGIWHFGTTGTLSLVDSTGNGTSTNHGMVVAPGEISGGMQQSSGGPSSTNYVDTGAIRNIAQQTVTTWQEPHPGGSVSVIGISMIASNTSTAFNASGYEYYTYNGGLTIGINNGSSESVFRWTNVVDHGGTYKYWAASYNGGNATLASSYKVYVNGVDNTSSGSIVVSGPTTMGTPTNNLLLSAPVSGEDNDCFCDEIHIWPAILTADWILDEYNNTSAPATFFTTGSFTPATSGTTQPWFGPIN